MGIGLSDESLLLIKSHWRTELINNGLVFFGLKCCGPSILVDRRALRVHDAHNAGPQGAAPTRQLIPSYPPGFGAALARRCFPGPTHLVP